MSSKVGFISHLTYLVQLPYLGKSQNTKNDQFRRKQHIVLWINNVLRQVFLLEASAETARHRSNTGRSPSPQLKQATIVYRSLIIGSSLPVFRSAPFVWYAVQTTSEIVIHWPARCPSVAVAGARLWNSLPHDIIASDTLSHFRRGLKTFLFRQSYSSILF